MEQSISDFSSHYLSAICAKLEITLQDARLLESEKNVDLYFDTADVRRAILGANEFTGTGPELKVNVEAFDRTFVLVDCLLAAEVLGKFTMFPPHQAEFLKQLRNNQHFQEVKRRITEQDFLEKVGITPGSLPIKAMKEQELRDFVNRQAGKTTERFFKAVQCIRYTWWERLKILRDKNIFHACNEKFDYHKLLENKSLKDVISAVEKIRPVHSQSGHVMSNNNFADAVTLIMLVELTRRFRVGESQNVPRFFDSTGLFYDVAVMSGLLPELNITFAGYTTCVLVRTDYFKHKATFRVHKDEVKAIYEELKNASDSTDDREVETLLESIITNSGKPGLVKKVKKLIDLSFLENVWLPTLAVDELKELAIRLELTTDDILSKQFKQSIDTTIAGTKRELSIAADQYKRFSTIWLDLKTDILELRHKKRTIIGGSEEFNPIRHLGLFRFTMPEETQMSTEETFEALLEDDIEDKEITDLKAWQDLIIACFSVDEAAPRELETNSDLLSHAQFVGAVLWAIKSYSRIIEIFHKIASTRVPFLVNLLFLASCFRLGKCLNEGEQLLNDLHEQYSHIRKTQRGSDTDLIMQASGMAYLWFHLWQTKRLLPAWWRCAKSPDLEKDKNIDLLIEKAVECAKQAWVYAMASKDPDEKIRERQIHITNQWLYYMVEQGDQSRLGDMGNAYQRIQGFRVGANSVWHPTYSDTLARYFSYLAYLSSTEDSWRNYIKKAETTMEDAIMAEKDDPAIREFGDYLVLAKEKGFPNVIACKATIKGE